MRADLHRVFFNPSKYSSRESACKHAGREPCTHLAASTAQPQNYENTLASGVRGAAMSAPANHLNIQKEPPKPGGSLFYLILKYV